MQQSDKYLLRVFLNISASAHTLSGPGDMTKRGFKEQNAQQCACGDLELLQLQRVSAPNITQKTAGLNRDACAL